ncbi:MAG: aldo/keto reductase, partial [Candidatus Omnitrophica bacterium]|nr:aldo/keto reductase [Candidatus Omnitrophota bacterium]
MQYKTIGNTKVPVIGQGTGGIKDVNIIKRGISLGLTLIDTAESYGNEEIIGKAIKGQRDKVFISDKFSPEHNGYDDVIKACETSLKRLGTDYIDLYSMHYPNPAIPLEETIRAFITLIQDGKIKHCGYCNLNTKQLANIKPNFKETYKILQFTSELEHFTLQNEYSLYERSCESMLPYCEQNDIKLIAYSPLKDLYQLSKDSMLWLQEIASAHEKTLAQVALNWLVSHKPVIALTCARDFKHQKENSEASDFTLSEDEIKKIDDLFKYEVSYIPVSEIHVSRVGRFPQTLEEAKTWSKWAVKPQDLDISEIKPIRVEKISHDTAKGYELLDGALPYYAWMLKTPGTPIPCLIKENEL